MNRVPNVGILYGLRVQEDEDERLIALVEKVFEGESVADAVARQIREGLSSFVGDKTPGTVKVMKDSILDILDELGHHGSEVEQDPNDPNMMNIRLRPSFPVMQIVRTIKL